MKITMDEEKQEIKRYIDEVQEQAARLEEWILNEQRVVNNPAVIERYRLEQRFWYGKEEAYKDAYALLLRMETDREAK